MADDAHPSPRVLAVIPARGGSKGVPRKNVREVGGKPLIAYTISAALQSGEFSAVLPDHIVRCPDDRARKPCFVGRSPLKIAQCQTGSTRYDGRRHGQSNCVRQRRRSASY